MNSERSDESSAPCRQHVAIKALANDARFRIVAQLAADGAPHGCQELIRLLGVTPPAVSNHLRVLEAAGLVQTHRRGAQVYAALAHTDLAYQMAAIVRAPQGTDRA
jgi:ArsR family transcriptional regulator